MNCKDMRSCICLQFYKQTHAQHRAFLIFGWSYFSFDFISGVQHLLHLFNVLKIKKHIFNDLIHIQIKICTTKFKFVQGSSLTIYIQSLKAI